MFSTGKDGLFLDRHRQPFAWSRDSEGMQNNSKAKNVPDIQNIQNLDDSSASGIFLILGIMATEWTSDIHQPCVRQFHGNTSEYYIFTALYMLGSALVFFELLSANHKPIYSSHAKKSL